MHRELYITLDVDLRLSKLIKKYQLSDKFRIVHRLLVERNDKRHQFNLTPDIRVKRKDQLLLNLQYNHLLHSHHLHPYETYLRYAEEFFTYFLNYEITTGFCSPQFPDNVATIFRLLDKICKTS